MTNIGTTRGSVTYLTNALLKISEELDKEFKALNKRESEIQTKTDQFINLEKSTIT